MVSPHVDSQTTHTDGGGRVAARQWKHYSRRYVTSEEEERFYRRDIFKIRDASGCIVWHSRSRKVLQISLLLSWGKKNINQCLHVKVGVCLTCLICYANCVSESQELWKLCIHSTLKWKGYGQCQETEFFQWGVLPLYTPLTKYPLKRTAGHKRLKTPVMTYGCKKSGLQEALTSSTRHVVVHPV